MPAVIKAYRDRHDLNGCQIVLDELLTGFKDDFAKYKKRVSALRLEEVFRSIVFQAGEKFKYAKVSDSGAHQGIKEALELLIKAGLVYKVHHTSARGIPLGAQIDDKKFKVILFDVGIHQRILGLDMSEQMVATPQELIHKGALAEAFTGLELVKATLPHLKPQLYYWHRESPASNAEVDYVIERQGRIVPIEVKAGTKGQMQSLFLFLKERGLPFGVRVSHENFGRYEKVLTVPIYAVQKLGAELE